MFFDFHFDHEYATHSLDKLQAFINDLKQHIPDHQFKHDKNSNKWTIHNDYRKYFDQLYKHHFDNHDVDQPQKLAAIHDLILQYENSLAAPILDFLDSRSAVRLIGKTNVSDNDRAPTIAFKPLQHSSQSIANRLQDGGIGTENGNFYAHRLISDLGIDADDGVVRLSLLHYNTPQDVEKILHQLELALN